MLPLLNIDRLKAEQLEDIKRVLRSNRVAFVEWSRPALPAYLCVRERDLHKATALVREEYRTYALAERAKWEREWKDAHKGSYWRWLLHRWRCNTKLAVRSLLQFIT